MGPRRDFLLQEVSFEMATNPITDVDLIAVDIAIAEVGNVALERVVHFQEDRELTQITLSKKASSSSWKRVVSSTLGSWSALLIVLAVGSVAFYDSLYYRRSREKRAPLLTLDKKSTESAQRSLKNNQINIRSSLIAFLLVLRVLCGFHGVKKSVNQKSYRSDTTGRKCGNYLRIFII